MNHGAQDEQPQQGFGGLGGQQGNQQAAGEDAPGEGDSHEEMQTGPVGVLSPKIPAVEGGVHQDDPQGAGNDRGGREFRKEGVKQGGDHHPTPDAKESCGQSAQGTGQEEDKE